jgi:CRP-like cAMP-binding protein
MTTESLIDSFPVWWQTEPADSESTNNMWDELRSALDIKQYVPLRAIGILSKELTDKIGRHFILKNGATHSYVRLSPEEFWVWEQLDGERTIQQLVLAYFMQFKAFAFDAIISLVDRLREGHMLAEPPRHLYADLVAGISRQSLSYKLSWVARVVFTKEFVIKKLDAHLDHIYRFAGWILFTAPIQVLLLLVSVIGTALFILLALDPRYKLLAGDTAWQLGVLAYIPLVIHEFGHAITAKHMGCEVYRGGVMLYYGLPAAFVDTTDVWFFGKRARLAVTWAGPYTGYIIGGICSIIVYLFRQMPLPAAVMLLQLAFVGILTSTFNILPLIKLDGYYLLADALEIPQLRERSVDFIVHHLRTKLTQRKKWSREEVIFLLFGILAILSTIYFTYAGVVFWDSQASTSLSEIFNFHGNIKTVVISLGIVIIALSAIYFSLALIAGSLQKIYLQLQRRGFLSNRWHASLALLILAVMMTFLPPVILPTLSGWFTLLGGVSAFLFVSWLCLSNFRSMRGSVYAWMWIPLSLAMLFGAVNSLGEFNISWRGFAVSARAATLGLMLIPILFTGRFLFNLRGSWRSLSLILLLAGAIVLALPLFINAPMEWGTLAGLLMLAGMLHWRMRPVTQIHTDSDGSLGSTREKIMMAYNEMHTSILAEVESDFGMFTRQRVETGAYQIRKKSVGEVEFTKSILGMTPNDYGGALALTLDELLAGVERLAGKKYAWRALAYGYDQLHWELQEIAEDYILKYVPHSSGLSNKLSEEHDELRIMLRSIPLFIGMPETLITALSKQFRPYKFSAGEEIVRAGEIGDSFYIVRTGQLEVVGSAIFTGGEYKPLDAPLEKDHVMFFFNKARRINLLVRGDYFGELALLEDKPHPATVRALTPAEVLRMGKEDFDRLIRNRIGFDTKTRAEIRRLSLLRQIPLFEGFDGGFLRFIVQKLEIVGINAGDSVFHQGDPGDKFYIIERGKAAVIIDGEQRATLGTGEYFGEISLLMKSPRSATVAALQPLELLQLRAEDFNALVEGSSAMKQALERASSRRIILNERWARQRQAEQVD